ncbi:hypothetical protein IKF94_00925 [Candidatus Saccharibacteria bacterium]|nr:hypothetical protein [Candidatus Saccharibacteria bacterium]
MEVNPYSNEDKEQRRRVIIVATTIAIIILGIAVWSIIAIVGNSKKNNTVATEQTAQVATSDNTGKSTQIETKPTESEAPVSEGVSTTNNQSTSATTTPAVHSQPAATTTTTSSVPETGPEEILPFALVLGSITTFAFSKKFATRDIF